MRVVEIPLPILINTRVLVCIISKNLVKKLKFKIKVNNRIKVNLLKEKSKIKVMNLISNISIVI